MTEAVITEHEGSQRGPVVRYYQYGNGGVRVLDAKKAMRRQYRFDPSSEIMTECDPARPDRTLRRFVFDKLGMVEEVFAFGTRPRTFRFEDGVQRIAIRDGGDYGAVGKLITFEDEGIAETVWGRNGEIERVLVFEPGNSVITERAGGWFGDVTRTFLFDRIDASVFRGPDAFLQFFVFTEWSEADRNAHIDEQVAKIRSEKKTARMPSPASARPSGVPWRPPPGGGRHAKTMMAALILLVMRMCRQMRLPAGSRHAAATTMRWKRTGSSASAMWRGGTPR
jgi:hypothetical protein